MSRHRNIRSMNITDEYDGYDDVYGHSVEDDYCISPSDAAFIYDREGSRGQQKISAFFKSDEDIAEEDESDVDKISALDDIDKARLNSCIEKIRSVLGELKISEQELVTLILKHNFAVEKIIDIILNAPRQTQPEKLEKDFNMKIDDKSSKQTVEFNCLSTLVSSHLKNSAIPKSPFLTNNTDNMFSKLRHSTNLTQNSTSNVDKNTAKTFVIPKLFSKNTSSVENQNETSSKLEKKYDNPTLFPNPTLSSSLPNTSSDSVPIAQNSSGIHTRNSEFPKKKFDIPNLFSNSVLSSSLPNSSLDNLSSSPQNLSDTDSTSHTSLSSLVSSHLGPKSKIEVPKLFTKSSPGTSPFNSLADLTKNHLQKSENKFKVPRIFGIPSQLSHTLPSANDFAKHKCDKSNSNNVYVGNTDSINIQSIDDKLTKCHINNAQVEREDILSDGWHIDLTNALRDSDIVPLKVSEPSHDVETEVFLPEFIDCESEISETHDFLQCNMDLKQFAYVHSALENSVSQFGKIISRTFRYRRPKMYYVEQDVIERFHFAKPSPDDLILAYVNRD